MRAALVGAITAALVGALAIAAGQSVAGTATIAPVPCSTYESALLAASIEHGHVIRLACVDGQQV